jgi:outer membrane biosynthesis protein TonB
MAGRNIVSGLICLSMLAALAVACVHAATETPADDSGIADAICPIVYPVDETPREDGYHYIFYGNAFFINKDGYLITAAHVLSAFRNGGGQPYILVGRPHAPAVLQKADLVAVDWRHDVAVLRANPNPFRGDFKVAFLPLRTKSPVAGNGVLAVALRPIKVQDPHTFQAPVHDRFAGKVVDYQFTQEEKGAGDTELLLFDHEVLRGQSGAPVVASDTQEVVGIVDGRWLRPRAAGIAARMAAAKANASPAAANGSDATPPPKTNTATPPSAKASTNTADPPLGAAVRIHYAIDLLQKHGIAWQAAEATQEAATNEPEESSQNESSSDKEDSVPFPISVVPAPYPPQSLFGGEVIFDALVDRSGTLGDAKVIHGDSPFLDKAQAALQTWSFRPARFEGKAIEERVGVAFEFAEPFLPSPKRGTHEYPEPPDADDRAPLPVYTVEPEYPPNTVDEGSVVVMGIVDAQGQLASTEVIRGSGPLASATISAMKQWRFAPGRKAGKDTDSVVIVVAAFRRPAITHAAPVHSPSDEERATSSTPAY